MKGNLGCSSAFITALWKKRLPFSAWHGTGRPASRDQPRHSSQSCGCIYTLWTLCFTQKAPVEVNSHQSLDSLSLHQMTNGWSKCVDLDTAAKSWVWCVDCFSSQKNYSLDLVGYPILGDLLTSLLELLPAIPTWSWWKPLLFMWAIFSTACGELGHWRKEMWCFSVNLK